jgi:hypothetical protein
MHTCFLADISDIIAGRPTDEALKTLHIICSSLKKFNLVMVNVSDNALGPKGIEACRGVLTSSSLEVMMVIIVMMKMMMMTMIMMMMMAIDDGGNDDDDDDDDGYDDDNENGNNDDNDDDDVADLYYTPLSV